jgi:hypothetical protein
MAKQQQALAAEGAESARDGAEVMSLEAERIAREAKISGDARKAKLEAINRNRNEFRGEELLYKHQVAPRRKLESKFLRGTLLSGAEVRPEYVGGAAELERLVRDGLVVRRAV